MTHGFPMENRMNLLATVHGSGHRGSMRWLALISIPVLAATPVVEELPRIPATSPQQAAANLVLRPGFHAELMVSEPLVVDPVAMAFDENGRLFVVEMRDYSERRDEKLGRVKLLEDTDEDGRFDKAHVFAEGLPWPTAVTCWDGGVFVAASPDLFYFKDTDGDHRADVHAFVFTGFGNLAEKLNVQALPNSLQWGPDQRIHGALGGNPGRVENFALHGSPRVELRGRDFSFDPRRMDLRPESGGGQWGMTFDDAGRKFVSANSRHIMQVLFDDRFAAASKTPLSAPAVDIAVDGPQAEVFRLSPEESWRVIRTKWRVDGTVKGPVEGGGRSSGYFTGACGITIYRGDAWPVEFRGNAFIADCGSNLVHRKILRGEGQITAERAADEKRSEFLASRDNWFRPVAFANAPDGCLWIADMAREVIEHPWSLPEPLKSKLDLNSGNDRGRIWRIVPDVAKLRPAPKLAASTTAELIAMLEHSNGWHRDTAARLLHERQPAEATPAIEAMMAKRTPKNITPAVAKGAAVDYVAPTPNATRAEAVALFRPALTLTGDSQKGRTIFVERCAVCHRFGGAGSAVGPDLDASAAGGREKLLGNILEPSREITAGFPFGIVTLKAGGAIAGIIANESPAGVVLRVPGAAERAIATANIAKVERPTQSLMPDGIETGMTPQQMAELLTFLAPPRTALRNLLTFRDADGEHPVTTPAQWKIRRRAIREAVQSIMGPLPGAAKKVPLDVKLEDETDCGSYVRRRITYSSEPGSRVPAFLLIPKAVLGASSAKAPAVLCLHPTDNTAGNKVVVGLGGKGNRQYAAELAERGFVTLAPAYPLLADYQPDVVTLGYSSASMKAIWDNIRGLDLLESLPFVQPGGFGAIGHSLGGHNSVFTALFDERIRVIVSSCGLDSFRDYKGGDLTGWTGPRYMPALAAYKKRLDALPFDFDELLAALAPRTVFISAPKGDNNFRADSVDRVVASARTVFELLGVPGNLTVEHPEGDHDFPDAMRTHAYELIDGSLKHSR